MESLVKFIKAIKDIYMLIWIISFLSWLKRGVFMKWKTVFNGIISGIVFLILINLIPKSKSGSGVPN